MSTPIAAIKLYLRRKYAGRVNELKAFADQVFAEASDEVVITSNSFEGGSASGQVRYNKMDLLQAIEELLVEAGEAPLGGRQAMVYADWSGGVART